MEELEIELELQSHQILIIFKQQHGYSMITTCLDEYTESRDLRAITQLWNNCNIAVLCSCNTVMS